MPQSCPPTWFKLFLFFPYLSTLSQLKGQHRYTFCQSGTVRDLHLHNNTPAATASRLQIAYSYYSIFVMMSKRLD
jgi:hypothetical protein